MKYVLIIYAVVLLKLIRGQIRSQRSKGHIHLKRYFSFIIRAMVMLLEYMKRLLNLYASCAPLINQRPNRVTGVISGLKLYDFLSPELNRVETFNLNFNNAFCPCTCVFFHRDRRSLRGSIGQICQNSPIHGICHWLSRARAVTGWETTLGRAWPVTGWETTRPLLFKGIRYPIIVKGVRHLFF